MKDWELQGADELMKNLNKAISKITMAGAAGLLRGAMLVRGESQRLTPVVTGNLRGSAYTATSFGQDSPSKKGDADTYENRRMLVQKDARFGPLVEIGYTANYATFVHEYPKAGKTGRKGASKVGEWRFLLTAMQKSAPRILQLVEIEAKKELAKGAP